MTFQEAIEEIKKCRGNTEAKRIAIECIKNAEADDVRRNMTFTKASSILSERIALGEKEYMQEIPEYIEALRMAVVCIEYAKSVMEKK